MNRTALALLVPVALVPAVFFACGGNNSNLPPPPPALQPTQTTSAAVASSSAPVASSAPTAAEDAGAPTPPPAPAPVLTAGNASPDPAAPTPTVKIAAPAKNQVIPAARAADFEVKLDVRNWATATGSQHVHLILDNTPYKAIYDTKKPIKLKELPGGDALAEGQHVLVAFPSRPNHESVKTPGALAIVDFYVGKKTAPTVDVTKPMLIYSRPKGEYKADMAAHILVDFQLANTTLETGKNVVTIAVTGPGIDGEKTARAEQFGPPFYLDNAQTGKYTLKLALVGPDGQPIAGPWNTTSRDIQVDTAAAAADTTANPHGAH